MPIIPAPTPLCSFIECFSALDLLSGSEFFPQFNLPYFITFLTLFFIFRDFPCFFKIPPPNPLFIPECS